MKKLLALLLAAATLLSLAACGKKKGPETVPTTEAVATEAPTTEPPTEAPTTAPVTEPTTEPATEPTEAPTEPELKYELDPKFKRVEETVYALREVNMRDEPSVSSHSPGKLPRGESVERIGQSRDGWSAVLYKDALVYIASEYLTTEKPGTSVVPQQPEKVTETAASGTMYTNHYVNFRKGPAVSYGILAQLPEGAKVELLAQCSNGWYKVNYNGTEGYVAGGYLSKEAPETTEPSTEPEKDEPGKDEPGKDEPGKDEPGKDEPGKDEPGKDEPGKDEPGKDEPGKDEPGKDEPGKDKPDKDKPGKDEPGKDKPDKDKPGKDKPGKKS